MFVRLMFSLNCFTNQSKLAEAAVLALVSNG
jgi:hypothetical protein